MIKLFENDLPHEMMGKLGINPFFGENRLKCKIRIFSVYGKMKHASFGEHFPHCFIKFHILDFIFK